MDLKFGKKLRDDSLTYIFRKIFRATAKCAFPNKIRILLLRHSGIIIENNTYIANGLTLACDLGQEKNLEIHKRVSIGPNVIIIIDSDPNISKLRHFKNKFSFIEVKGKITIEQDAWICAGAILLPNISIGRCAIVGAGSVVTKDVPPFTVVAGNPARIIKKMK